ncbi:MAG: rRNA adenine N-6-methyltransferase family protein [Candidatus Woesearchaeota archaeon]
MSINKIKKSPEVIYDQHFLNNSAILSSMISTLQEKILKQEIQKLSILEIGGGEGVLTKEIIALNPQEFVCVEIDENLITKLESLFSRDTHRLIHDNAINYLQNLKPSNFTFNVIIGNIPYSITQPLYTQLFFLTPQIAFFLQSHKTSRTILEKETKLSYLLNSLYELEITQIIKGENFTPPAKTLSSTLILTLRKDSDKTNFDTFLTLLTKRYNQQFNNSIVYSLAQLFGVGKKEIKLKLEKENVKLSSQKLNVISNEEFLGSIEQIKEVFFKKE